MNFLEKDLEEIIYNADRDFLSQRELYIRGKLLRQLRIGNYGIADLVEFNRPFYHPYYCRMMKGEINVIELKKENISVSSFLQAVSYLHGIKRFLSKRGVANDYNYSITLIGRNLDTNSSFVYLDSLLKQDSELKIEAESVFNLQLYTYGYEADGIYFYPCMDYHLINEGF